MIYLTLFWTFFKIGLFTFGGGYAMIPLIQDAVFTNNWITGEEFINFIAVSESTPGPFAINMATYVGSQVAGADGVFAGILGAGCATLGVVTPSFVIILLVAKCFDKFRNHKIVAGCMKGLKPAVVGLIAAAMLSIGKTVLFPNGFSWEVFTNAPIYLSLAIFAIMTVLAFKKTHPIVIVCISAVIGITVGLLLPLPIV
ncbi:MAG: chromate transporter [Clostridiales bacterium]|nr:chromate transporter [Clostridiales bacterium]